MIIKNTIRNEKGQTITIVETSLSKDIKKLYNKYKYANIDYDSFHLLICDLSSINRTMNIAIDACE